MFLNQLIVCVVYLSHVNLVGIYYCIYNNILVETTSLDVFRLIYVRIT